MSSTPDGWLLIADRERARALKPLIDSHAEHRPVQVRQPGSGALARLDDVGAILVVGGARCPRAGSNGPFLEAEGRRIPAGWLPAGDDASLGRFASAAADVGRRQPGRPATAILAQWDDHALHAAARSAELMRRGLTGPGEVNLWTADRIIRRDLLQALRLGPALALYYGHGRAYGWVGYHGLHLRHVPYARGSPCGAILSLTCRTALRSKGRHSFCERLVLEGVAAAALGAVGPTRTTENWRWGLSISRALAAKAPANVGELLLAVLGMQATRCDAMTGYRLIGDPCAILASDPETLSACAQVDAPDP